eukprot:CAMPEP_0174720158 /NCGR_PEP_ID=MMETSP1094-20130205/32916_1 /TAXON_ID=156173 /ORGANISM="Chrysochromulina brevifilum, Strain UTEX LB 985" /LENGTH=269 /DNA_ID=CAMNT_0015920607 /DNA_START=24 /DNA_END=833 /DNA_ORIENTATION=+
MSLKRGASLARLESAFHTFDLDGSGHVSAANLEAILMRPGTEHTLSKEDVAEIVNMFDEDGSGTLNILEFEKAMSMFGSFLSEEKEALLKEHELHQLEALTACAAPYAKQIAVMFAKMDEEKSGYIVPVEGTISYDVLEFYYDGMGLEYDEDTLVQWHKAHDETSDKAGLDVESFARYLAELAQCEDGLIEGVVESFGDALEYILARRAMARSSQVKQMVADAKAVGSKATNGPGAYEMEDPPKRKIKQSGSKRFAQLAALGASSSSMA